MKPIFLSSALILISLIALAQTPIDVLQKNNSQYLTKMEAEGFQFRSQIVTEFNPENAQQNVNIRLKAGHTYQLVAIGDSDVKAVNLEVKSSKKFELKDSESSSSANSQKIRILMPEKSGKFKITLNVQNFSEAGKGFVSFMVLRK